MRSLPALFAVLPVLSACSERFCSDPDVCWANRNDVVEAAEGCGIENFEPRDAEGSWLPYVEGEDSDTGAKTNCIIDGLKGQGLMVTH